MTQDEHSTLPVAFACGQRAYGAFVSMSRNVSKALGTRLQDIWPSSPS